MCCLAARQRETDIDVLEPDNVLSRRQTDNALSCSQTKSLWAARGMLFTTSSQENVPFVFTHRRPRQ